jgi:SagB-type dehydrogenase family enzyme
MTISIFVNQEIKYALNYHEATKHSEASLMSSRHYLDFDNKPIPFKIYLDQPSVPLPIDFPKPEVNALSCISSLIDQRMPDERKGPSTQRATMITSSSNSKNTNADIGVNFHIENLAEILFFSAGITRELNSSYGKYYMRAASATGALYPIELYVVCEDISPDLMAGVYHFSPADFGLTRIRKGKYKEYLEEATAKNKHIANSAINIIFTSIAWRNAWKYQARSYRHWFWDSGVIAANLLAIVQAMDLPAHLIMGFLDDSVSQLLCLEDQREAPIALAAIGGRADPGYAITSSQQQSDLRKKKVPHLPTPKIRPLSRRGEINYPEIWKLNSASKLTSKEEIEEWIRNAHRYSHLIPAISKELHKREYTAPDDNNSTLITPNELEEVMKKSRSLKETILWRGSSRRFARSNISISALKTILFSSTRAIPMDTFKDGNSVIDIYFIANDVEGLNAGAYFYNRNTHSFSANSAGSIEKLREIASSRNISGYLCLGQPLFSDASVVFFLMTDLQSMLKSFGNRGYRISQFEAGIIAGKIYLSAYALGIGASGSTFFDDAVTEVFSPHATNKSCMIAVGVGIPAYKANPGKIVPRRKSKEQLLAQAFI